MKFVSVLACLFSVCAGRNPNILFIMMDDLGYGDLSARYSEFYTPNLDELYHSSIVLDSHYIGISVCSPSRAQILTGRYAWNLGLASLSNFQTSSIASFPAGMPTIADLLKQHTEYRTYALGKWHVGYASPEHTPLYRGFDEFYGFLTSGIDYYDKTMTQPIYDGSFIDWWANDEFDFETQNVFSTQVTGDRVIEIIDKHAHGEYKNTPFYIYGAFQAPHENLEYVTSKFENNCDSLKGDVDLSDSSSIENSRYAYCLNIMKMDEMLENIVKNLKANHLWDHTLIVFTSDNGGAYMKGSCNYPLTGGKASYFEGGVRTVAFVSGGYVPREQQGTTRSGFFHGADWTPTLLSIAGANVGHVKSELETDVYTPVAAKVSTKNHGTTEYASDYLIDSPFDGVDLSDWLLYGDESSNTRTDVPLSIGSLSDSSSSDYNNFMDDEVEDIDELEEDIDEDRKKESSDEDEPLDIEEDRKKESSDDDEARRLIAKDHDGGDISLVWKSEITNNIYKMIYSPSSTRLEKQTCTMENNKAGVELTAFLTNELLFDISLDSKEETNLMDNVEYDFDGGFSHRRLLKSSKNSIKTNNRNIRRLADYEGDTELAIVLWNEGLNLAVGYGNSVLYNDYLGCAEKTFYNDGDPSQFETPGWQPFMKFAEFIKKFQNLCEDDTNDVLYELYTTTYSDYIEAAQSHLGSKISKVAASDDSVENDDVNIVDNNDDAIEENEEIEEEIVSPIMKGKTKKKTAKSTSVNTHMFGNNGSHTLMVAGIILAIAFVILGYCLFYWVRRRNDKKYEEYTVIAP